MLNDSVAFFKQKSRFNFLRSARHCDDIVEKFGVHAWANLVAQRHPDDGVRKMDFIDQIYWTLFRKFI